MPGAYALTVTQSSRTMCECSPEVYRESIVSRAARTATRPPSSRSGYAERSRSRSITAMGVGHAKRCAATMRRFASVVRSRASGSMLRSAPTPSKSTPTPPHRQCRRRDAGMIAAAPDILPDDADACSMPTRR